MGYRLPQARLFSFTLLLLSLVGVPARAQEFTTIERGFKPERAFQVGQIDDINLFNGGLTLSVPIGQPYPVGLGGELTYSLTLHYSHQVWDYITNTAPPGWPTAQVNQAWPAKTSNAGLGWRLSLGEYWDNTVVGVGACSECYVSPDGAQHKFYQDLHPDVPDGSSDTLYTRDSTYLRLRRSAREIDFPNGEIHAFDSAGRLTQMRDRLGNALNVTYGASSWTLSDGHRSHTVNLVNVSHYGKAVGSVVLATFGGTTATYTFGYTEVALPRSCLDDDPATSEFIQVPLLSSVTLPDGSSYQMPAATAYNVPASASDCRLAFDPPYEGLLLETRLPTRGKVIWLWRPYEFPVPWGGGGEPPPYLTRTAGVDTRILRDDAGNTLGTWTYTPQLPGGQLATEAITTVISPLGDRTEHFFKVGENPDTIYGLPISAAETAPGRPDLWRSSKVYDCAAGGVSCVLKRTIYRKYATDTAAFGGPEFNPRQVAVYTRYHDDADRWVASDSSEFDGLGNFRTTTLSGNFGAADSKTLKTNYNQANGTYPGAFTMPTPSAAWVLGTYDFQSTSEGTQTFRSDFCFDVNTGFLLRSRTRASNAGTTGTNDLISVFSRLPAQAKITALHYGGDLAGVGTSGLCSLTFGGDSYRLDHTFQHGALKTSQFSTSAGAVVLKHVDRTIDPNTGRVSSEKDPTGLSTAYVFDNLGRILQIKPQEDAWIGYSYTAPITGSAVTRIRTHPNGNFAAPQLTDLEIVFDDLGRVRRERRRMPGGVWARRTRFYDGLSQLTDLSEWQVDAAQTAWNRYRNYDPFGRPGHIDPPEGQTHRITFSYTGDRVAVRSATVGTALVGGLVSETSVSITERRDRQGRLSQLVDATGTTTYGYDPAGRLSSVNLSGQLRSFVYDGRGFLTSETHPEKGASGNGTVTYSRYDAAGNLGSRSDGPMSVDYIYDRAGRLLRITEPGASGANIKVFTFGTGGTAADRSAGKIKTAERYNYVRIGMTPFTVLIRETYTYAGRSGRISRRDTQAFVNGATAEGFTQSFDAYNDLGELTSLSYPQCLVTTCSVQAPRTVSFNYDNGYLASVPGWASAITYHRNGLMASVAHANGVTVNQVNDDASRLRPKSIATAGALNPAGTAEVNWTSGDYAYDGSGNVIQIGSSRFLYDSVSRLASAAIPITLGGTGTADQTQSYTYDSRGNLTSTTTNGVLVNTPASASTNRLTGAVNYDDAGNLISWNGNTYEYDRMGMMWRMQAGTLEDLYLYTADDERLWIYHIAPNTSNWTLRDLSGKVLREYINDGVTWSVNRDYVYRGGLLLGAATPAGNQHFANDHLGTPRLITNATARRLAYHAYFPFGREATLATLDTERMKFTGHERDLNATTGANPTADDLDYMHARFYNPNLPRFLSVDPVPGDPSNSQSWNRYSYALNNPLKFIDPTGLYIVDCKTGDKGCQADLEAFEKARQAALESNDSRISDAAKAYGEPEEANGVVLVFEKVEGENGHAELSTHYNDATEQWEPSARVSIRPKLRGTDLFGAVVHEGDHVVTGWRFSAALNNGGSIDANPTWYDSEVSAYELTHLIYGAANESFNPPCQRKGQCSLGTGVLPAQVRQRIDNLLADPTGIYKITPQNPGGPIVRFE